MTSDQKVFMDWFCWENLRRKPELFSHEIWDFPANCPLNQSIERDEMMKHVFSVTNCTSRFRFGKHEDIHEVNNSHCGGPMVIFLTMAHSFNYSLI